MREKDTKTHQKRRIALDEDTIAVLGAHLERQDEDAARVGAELGRNAYLFALDPDCARPLVPALAIEDARTARWAESDDDRLLEVVDPLYGLDEGALWTTATGHRAAFETDHTGTGGPGGTYVLSRQATIQARGLTAILPDPQILRLWWGLG
jgi:hypothetical protein